MIYTPAEDSYLLEKQVSRYAKGKSVIDIGTGSGILAEAARSSGGEVVVSDIDPEAIINARKKGFESYLSDLFENIKGKFDLIVFNPPYLPEHTQEDEESRQVTTGGKKGDEIILRFLKQARDHLNKKGIILLLLSSLTPRKKIAELMKKLKFRGKLVSEEKLFFEKLEVWEISVTI